MIALAGPIVQVIYERGAFNSGDSQLVGSVLTAASLGMFVYLGRDVMVRAFYALGDANAPFRISLVNIGVNALLDWILVPRFGAPGIVLATVGVNALAMIVLLWLLDRRLGGLPWGAWAGPFGGVLGGSLLAGLTAWGVRWQLTSWLGSSLGGQILLLAIASVAGLGVFAIVAWRLNLPEVRALLRRRSGGSEP
jgi:putative peptidoglycan lipid II flippase